MTNEMEVPAAMKHVFLPLPIETVRNAWEEWQLANRVPEDGVHLIEAHGGCFVVTNRRPPKVFIELLKGFIHKKSRTLARVN